MTGTSFFDNGRTGEHLPVTLRLLDQGLEIRDCQDGLMLALWAFDDITADRPPGTAAEQILLRNRMDPEDSLSVGDAAVLAHFRPHRKRKRTPALKPRANFRRLSLTLLALLLSLIGLYEAALSGARPLSHLAPPSWQRALGARMATPLIKEMGGSCHNPDGLAVLDALSRRFNESAAASLPMAITIVRNPGLSSLVLPDGEIIVSAGLLREAGNGDALAALLAHQLAHALLGHSMEQALRHAGFGLFFLLMDDGVSQERRLAALLGLPFSRQAETEADALARRLLEQAAISAQSTSNFFHTLMAREKSKGSQIDFLAAHQIPERRADPGPPALFVRPALTAEQWTRLASICD
ncbi:MAG TPA: M48 family metalloprotease [Rhodospirillaceae bacterium]|nr:M48 family metalloprotease [Rhodospirillaceae bacterium]